MPLIISSDANIVTSAPTISSFSTSAAVWIPLLAARLACTRPSRMPIQHSGSLSGLLIPNWTERRSWNELEHLQVDVRLLEAVEQHQAVGAGQIQSPRQRREIGEIRAQLDRDRNAHGALDGAQDVHEFVLDGARSTGAGRSG